MTKRPRLMALIAVEVVAILVIAAVVWFIGDRKIEPVAVNETCTMQDSGIDWLNNGNSAEMISGGAAEGESVTYNFSNVVVDLQCPGLGYAIAHDAVPVSDGGDVGTAEPGSVLALFIDGIPIEQQYDVMRIGGVERVSSEEIRVRYEMGDGSDSTVVTYSLADLEAGAQELDEPEAANVAGDGYAVNAASPRGYYGTGVRDVRIRVVGSNVQRYYMCGLRVPRPTKVYNRNVYNAHRTTINAAPGTTGQRNSTQQSAREEETTSKDKDKKCSASGSVPSWLASGKARDLNPPKGANDSETSSTSSSASSSTSFSTSSSTSTSTTSTTTTRAPTTSTTTTPPAVTTTEPIETQPPAQPQTNEAPAAVDVEVAPLASSSKAATWKVKFGKVSTNLECPGLSWAIADNSEAVPSGTTSYTGDRKGSVIVFMIDGELVSRQNQLAKISGVQRVDADTVKVQYSSGTVTYSVKGGKLSTSGNPGSAVIADLK